MKKIVFLLIAISTASHARSYINDFSYSRTQTNLNTHHINLKDIQIVKKKEVFSLEKFNSRNKIGLFLGLQRDEYETEPGIFVQQLNQSLFTNWSQLFNNYIGYEVEGGITKNAIIPKLNLMLGTGFSNNLNFFLLGQLGSKIALVRQVSSGYFFVNVGAGIDYRISDYRFNVKLLVPQNMFNEVGWEVMALKQLQNEHEAGVFISQENYYPQKIEYSRQGQDVFKIGLIYFF